LKRARNLLIIGTRISRDDSTAILNALGQGDMPHLLMIEMETVVGMDLHVLKTASKELQQLESLHFTGTYSTGAYSTGERFAGGTVRMTSGELIPIIAAFPKLRHLHLRSSEQRPPGLDYSGMLNVMRHVNNDWWRENKLPLESMTVYHDRINIVQPTERSPAASESAEDALDDRRRYQRQ
jgi:hypothetical protein